MLRIAPFPAAGLILGLCVTVAIFLIVERGRLTVDSAALQQQRRIAEAERDGMLDALAQQSGALPQLALAAGLGATGGGARARLGDLVELWRRNHGHSAVWAFKDGADAVAFQKDTAGPFSGEPAGPAAAFLEAARAQTSATAQAHYLKIGDALYRAAYVRSDIVMREMPAAEFLVLSSLGSKPEEAGPHAGGLPGLSISAEPPPPGGAVPILDATGQVIGSMRWRPLLPGHAMIAEIGPAAIPLVIVTILAFLLLARVWIRQSDRVRDALAQAEVSALSERTKAMFFANLSHELRTPLNAIIGFAETMKLEIFGPIGNVRYASYTGDIHASARHLLQLIDNVLIFTRSEVDHSGSTLEPVCLTEILDSARTILAPPCRSQKTRPRHAGARTRCTLHGPGRSGPPDRDQSCRQRHQVHKPWRRRRHG